MSLAALAAAAALAPPVYVTENYGFTFRAPEGSWHCPLTSDWVGSDHGTIIFLERPKSCGGAGYPSSSRSFEPVSTPRILIYYGYDVLEADEKPPPVPCQVEPNLPPFEWMGAKRPVCRSEEEGLVILRIEAEAGGKPPREVSARLVTAGEPTYGHFMTFMSLVMSLRSCGEAGASATPCPSGVWF